jgi:hypothetical protein
VVDCLALKTALEWEKEFQKNLTEGSGTYQDRSDAVRRSSFPASAFEGSLCASDRSDFFRNIGRPSVIDTLVSMQGRWRENGSMERNAPRRFEHVESE